MKKTLARRLITDYNAVDLYRVWGQKYHTEFGRLFQGFPARDLKLLKELLDANYTPAQVILAMDTFFITKAANSISIPVFMKEFENHIIDEPQATWYYLIASSPENGRLEMFDLFSQYMMMDADQSQYRNIAGMEQIKVQLDKLLEQTIIGNGE